MTGVQTCALPICKREALQIAPEARLAEEPERGGLWQKLRRGLTMTHTELVDKMSAAFQGRVTLDDATLEYLEEILISADLGVDTSLALVERVRANATRDQASSPARLRKLLADEMAGLLEELPRTPAPRLPRPAAPGAMGRPRLTLVVGVNGVGKTTTIGKLAKRQIDAGRSVVLAAGEDRKSVV